MIFIFVWLTLCSMIMSSSIYIAANSIISFFLWLSNIPLSVCSTSFLSIYLSMSFHVLPVVNSAAVNVEEHISFWIKVLSGYMTRSGIGRSNGNFIFSFPSNLHTVFHSDSTNLHFYQQCRRILFSPHPLQHLLFVDFLNDEHSDWYEMIPHWVLICIPLIISNIEHLFISLLVFFGDMSI